MKPFPFRPAALVFDLDGTLLDTEPLYSEATQQLLDPYGHTYTLELKKRVMGGDSMTSARLTIEEFDLPMSPQQYLNERESYLEVLFPAAPEIASAGAFLALAHQQPLPLGLATSSHRHLCDLKLQHRDWKDIFTEQVCGDDPALQHGKPAPDIFLLCAERLAVDPRECIAFEDSRNGIAAAKAAGMFVVALESPYTEDDDLAEADLQVVDYRSLI